MPKWKYSQTENDSGYGDIYIGDRRNYRHDDYVRLHNADIDALTAERDKWRLAVIDAAVVNWTYTKEDEDNPYLAVCKLLGCAARDALDPQISLDAKALYDRIAELEAECDNANAYATWVDGLTLELATVTAERDELQRRLDKIRDWAVANEEGYPLGAWIVAIAEGRDNG